MLLRKFDFNNGEATNKFLFDGENHIPTWEHYAICYSYTLKKIFNKGLKRNYAFNCRAYGLLFLFRQYLELCLKRNLERNGCSIPNSHDFQDLISASEKNFVIPNKCFDVINQINYDSDGSSYRYYTNTKTGFAFFSYEYRIELANILKDYNNIVPNDYFIKDNICESFDYESRRLKWDLTFHMGEIHGLGHIRTQYDEVIEFIVEGLLFENWDINRVYLPLLFLIRHSLEIALKFNLQKAKEVSPTKILKKEYSNIHSLFQLYNCFGGDGGYLSKLDLSKLSVETKKQYDNYKTQYEVLNEVVHQLDINSRYFRFPVDTKGKTHLLKIKSESIIDILKLYYLTDPFISFAFDVLEYEGVR